MFDYKYFGFQYFIKNVNCSTFYYRYYCPRGFFFRFGLAKKTILPLSIGIFNVRKRETVKLCGGAKAKKKKLKFSSSSGLRTNILRVEIIRRLLSRNRKTHRNRLIETKTLYSIACAAINVEHRRRSTHLHITNGSARKKKREYNLNNSVFFLLLFFSRTQIETKSGNGPLQLSQSPYDLAVKRRDPSRLIYIVFEYFRKTFTISSRSYEFFSMQAFTTIPIP